MHLHFGSHFVACDWKLWGNVSAYIVDAIFQYYSEISYRQLSDRDVQRVVEAIFTKNTVYGKSVRMQFRNDTVRSEVLVEYRVFTKNENSEAYTGTDFSHKILQFVCAVCMAQHSCSLHLYVQFVLDACRLQYGCAIQIAHTNPELHKSYRQLKWHVEESCVPFSQFFLGILT